MSYKTDIIYVLYLPASLRRNQTSFFFFLLNDLYHLGDIVIENYCSLLFQK